jgi:hypothetical protein
MKVISQVPKKLHFVAMSHVGEIWEGYKAEGKQGWKLYVFDGYGWRFGGGTGYDQMDLFKLRELALKENPDMIIDPEIENRCREWKERWLSKDDRIAEI